MQMQIVDDACRHHRRTEAEAVRFGDRNHLVGILGDPGADERIVDLRFGAGDFDVEKGSTIGLQLRSQDRAVRQFLWADVNGVGHSHLCRIMNTYV